jgi:glycosyltransferase involved in cell wall biosynthesis
MWNNIPHISVCICTFKRPALLAKALLKLDKQETDGRFTYSIVVVDNDRLQSAKATVEAYLQHVSIPVKYCCEPQKNIALARNHAIINANGEFLAFIDDDEYPAPQWLGTLLSTCIKTEADGVLGPVVPYFEAPPPQWVVKGRFFDRPTHATGDIITLSQARTGNVLFRKNMFVEVREVFRKEFGTGGEDVDFFRRMMNHGYRFIWCNEAVVHELVPATRCRRRYLLKRALLRGSNLSGQPKDQLINVAKSLIAVPIYAMVLPFLILFGHQYFFRFLIKLCDHGGRILALVKLNPIKDREVLESPK